MALSSGSWRASTNWDAGEGSLEGSISFETSSDDAPASPSPAGTLLLRPNSDDPPPCEITVYFQEKHEIHMLYVKSTARVFEIYYAADLKYSSKEYLATVRCGPAAEVPSSYEGKIAEGKHENIVRSDSTSSDEDGWVEVKLPDSPLHSNGFSQANNQMHYEATAEISDASPCISVTLRLLSLETKASVHVEEIYIYADPVESLAEDSPAGTAGGNSAGSSILTMLVPNLLQLSKSARPSSSDAMSMRIEAHFDLEDLNLRSVQDQSNTKHINGHSKSIQILSDQESYSMENQDLGPMQVESKVNPENVPSESCQKAINLDQATNCVIKEDMVAHSRIENMVNDLLCKVRRIESCCLRLEENMMKPLSCIEMRLQRLEEKFDAFQMEIQSLKEVAEMPTSASSFEKFDLENKAWKSSCTEGNECDMSPGLVVKAPDFSVEELYDSQQLHDNDFSHCRDESKTSPGLVIKAPEFPSEELLDTADNVAASEEESKLCQGLVVEAPEFPSEDEEYTNNDDDQDRSVMNNSNHKKPLSIDGALASALAAFLTSSRVPSPKCSPSVVDMPHNFPVDSDYNSDSLVFPEGAGNISNTSFSDEQDVGSSAEVKDEAAFYASLLSANVEAVPDCSLNKSVLENKNCYESDEAKKDSTLDSSGFAGDFHSFVPLHHSSSCLLVSMPDYSKHEFIDICGASDSDENLGPSSLSTDAQPTLSLTKFLSSRKVNSSSHKSTMLGYPELFTAEKIQFGVEKSDSCSSGNNVKEHGELNLKFEQNRSGASCSIAGKADVEELPMHNVLRPTDVCSDEGEENTWRGSLSFKTSNAEEDACEGPYINCFGRVWTEDSSTDSSFDENFIRSKVEIYCTDGSSTDSMMHSSSQFADIFGTSEPSIENSVNHDRGVELAIGDLQKAFNVILNFEDSNLDANFTPVRKSDATFPLEALLSGISNCKEQASVYRDGDTGVSADGLANSSSSPRVGSLPINQCLVDVEDLPTPSETCAGSGNFEQFYSLI